MMAPRGRIAFAVLLALLALSAWWHLGRSTAPAAGTAPPHIVLVTIDTMRADRLRPDLTPTLSVLASQGVQFRTARSPVPLTLPAHVSLMTGLLPPSHGVRENGHVLPVEIPRLASWLGAAGYSTAAFVGAFVLDRRFGLAAGFDTYDDRVTRDPRMPDRLEAERPAEQVVDAALRWLNARPAGMAQPYLLWLHLYDPHAPYRAPGPSRAGLDPYDAEVSYADAQLARLISTLSQRGDLDRSVVIVAGDHGESLGDHDERTHGMLLYDASLRVPAIVRAPGLAPGVRDEPISLVDLCPSVLQLSGRPIPPGLDGVSLFARTPSSDRDVYSETQYPRAAGWSPLAALTTDRWKLIASRETELYDLQLDPAEQHNVSSARQSTATAMLARLTVLTDRKARARESVAINAEAAERLRALGYVAFTATEVAGSTPGPNPASVVTAWVQFEDVLDSLARGRAPEALSRARELADRFPDGALFQVTYARALTDVGRADEALRVYRRAANRFTGDALLLHDLAVAARSAGDLDEAVRAERAAIILRPDYAAAHNGLGLSLIDQRKSAEAAAAFTEAVRLDERHTPFLINLGNARRELSDFAGAETSYKQALEMDPSDADAANGVGAVLAVTGRSAEAIPWFQRAIAADAGFYEARLNLGIAYQETDQIALAEEAYRAVLGAPQDLERERRAARTLLQKLSSSRR